MKSALLPLLAGLISTATLGQQYRLSTEVQSSFIDITGLFGVKEPASITQFSYVNRGVGVDLYHSFSLRHVGNAIQTLVVPSYRFRLDSAGHWFFKPKAELFYNQPSGGGYIRPGYHLLWQPNPHHLVNFGN